MTLLSKYDRACRVFASQGFSVAAVVALPQEWQVRFADLCPENGEWYSQDETGKNVHKMPDLPARFSAIWQQYQESLKAVIETPVSGPAIQYKSVSDVQER